MLNLNIKKITVLTNTCSTDVIYFDADIESPYPEMKYPPLVKMEAAAGYGKEYVKKVFGREPDEVIDVKFRDYRITTAPDNG